ncbi:hypothetical protein Tco_0002223 [Tanacetum coccineum]
MLAPGNYVQWKYRIKSYIDTKPNSELIHYCLQNPPYKYQWAEKTVPVAKGSFETTTERYKENYKNVSQDIRDQLNAEAEAVQIILTGINNDIYSTIDACSNACKMWKAIERSQQSTRNRGKAIVTSSAPTYDTEPDTVTEDEEIGTGYNNQRAVNVAGARENVEEAEVQLNAEQADWKDDTDDESEDQELKAHYMYMAQLQEVTPDQVDNSGPIFDDEPMHKVQNNNDNYNVFAMEKEHPEQPESSNDIYLEEQDLKKFQAELDKYNDVNYASKKEIDCAKAKGDLISYKIGIEKKTWEKCEHLEKELSKSRTMSKSFEALQKQAFNLELDLQQNASRTANILEHKTPRCSTVSNTPLSSNSFAARTVKFGNDQIAPILGYGDLVQGTITIKRVYYVEGLNHNLFSVGQFCDADF